MIYYFILCCFIFKGVVSVSPYLNQKPEWAVTCDLNAEKSVRDACTTDLTDKLFKKMINGIPELKIPSLDPLTIPQVEILSGNGPVNLNMSLTNLIIKGFKNTKIERNVVDMSTYTWDLTAKIPKLRLDGKYLAKGQILVVPITGNGDCFFDCSDVEAKCQIYMTVIKKPDHTFLNVTDVKADFDMQDLKFNLDNLLEQEDKKVGMSINQYLQENWREIKSSLQPILNETVEKIFKHYLTLLLKEVPGDYLFSNLSKK